jgi:NADH-quinone oxidoreductase subunit D
MAIDYGTSGPVLRGSGVDHDLRRDGEEIYTAMYDDYAFEVIAQKNGHYPKDHDYPAVPTEAVLGDCWHRFYVRMLEVVQSIDLVRQAMDRYSRATGSYGEPLKLNQKLPKGEVYLETEAPRGQMGFYIVSNGEAIPWRRDPVVLPIFADGGDRGVVEVFELAVDFEVADEGAVDHV